MHKVIFDTDPGIDDAMALLFLHQHPDIELVGITTVFGNAAVTTTTRNALWLKQQWGIACPVAQGAGETLDPFRKDVGWPDMIHGADGLGDIGIPDIGDLKPDPRPAHRFIIDMLRASPGEITIVAVGRMTNLALALADEPAITGLVKAIVIMGGAFDVRGNITPAAEANIHGDPEAADVVMTAPWPVVAIGLDVTEKTVMTRGRLAAIVADGHAPVKLVSDMSQFYIDFYETRIPDGMVIHDSCAAAYVIAPELFTTRSGPIRVVCGGIADGQTIQSPDSVSFPPSDWDGYPSQTVCTGIDASAVLDLIHATLSRPPAPGGAAA